MKLGIQKYRADKRYMGPPHLNHKKNRPDDYNGCMKLTQLYEEGYQPARQQMEDLKKYLEGTH